ncbi:phage portal protein [Nocardiopsis synnemataformans]|uniref:phage portal protein n=1 Tax=Nocardiopsis synnemataformans TaxID=61305 RepID=UPI003EBBAB70
MGLLDRVSRHMRGERAWPVGGVATPPGVDYWGHQDERFAGGEEYGDYVATSAHVYAAVSLRARLMSSLELRLYAGRGAKKQQIEKGPVYDLLQRVNPHWTLRRLIRMDEMAMGIWGESFWAVERDSSGTPSEIWWLKADRVRPVVHETKYISEFIYEPVYGGQPVRFRPDEIVWFRYPNPNDEFSPLSPLAAARLAADTASSMMRANAKLFENGLLAGGVVVPATDKATFTAEQARDLERDLARRFKGVDNAHRWAVLRYEAQLKGLSVTPQDAQFVEGLDLTLRDVGNAYGIPTPLLNDAKYATLSNAREYQQILWAHALVPDADLRADEITEQLLPMFGSQFGYRSTTHVAWNYESVPALQEAESDIWGRDRQAMEAGAMTINEWRAKKGMPAVPWGDVWWAPANKFAVSDEESVPAQESAEGPAQELTEEPSEDEQEPPVEEPEPGENEGEDDEEPLDIERAWNQVLAAFNEIGSPR